MISLIIPTLNEEHNIKNVLTYVLNLSGAYEVIVVDGGSQDNTVSIVEEEPRVRLIKSSKGRAIQMNIGAKYAKGTFLLFLHADTYLPENALSKINSFESDFEIAAGGFKHQFSSNDWRLKFISFLHNYRCKKSRLFYGDQALFVRRSLFNELGGYPNQTILEDWSFGQTLRNATAPIFIDEPVVTDSRKFEQIGIWRSFIRVITILTRLKFGLDVSQRHPFFQQVR